MKANLIPLAAFALFLVGCDSPTATTAETDGPEFARSGPLVHHASMGGSDLCEAIGQPTGCDANFSLTANMKADGSVSGQWQDTFAGGGEGIHVAVDCLNVVGNAAVIGGVITHGTANGADVSGLRALTTVVDNGTSSNDPADQLSLSFIGYPYSCTDLGPGAFPLFDLTNGQVKVW